VHALISLANVHLIEDVLKTGVIKATPNRKCYIWYAKMLDSNFWCLNVEMIRDQHSASPVWDGEHVLCKGSMIRSYHVFKEI